MNIETKSAILSQIEEGYLDNLTIEVTEQCNFKCGHCLRGPADKSVFNVETLRILLENTVELQYIGSIVFTGGEPLLHPEIIEEVIQMLWRFKVEVGSFYIATNGSAFNKESFMAIGRLYEFCQDNEISAIEISNSKWHKEERKRLGLFNSIPTCFEDIYEYFPEDIEYVMENYYPCLSEINFCADHRTYKNMVQEGRYTGPGEKVSVDIDKENRKKQSKFLCLCCGLKLNADINASRVIYARSSCISSNVFLNRKTVLKIRLDLFVYNFSLRHPYCLNKDDPRHYRLATFLENNPYFK